MLLSWFKLRPYSVVCVRERCGTAGAAARGRREPAPGPVAPGSAVQVDPIKPTVKAPGIKRLTLIRDDEPLSNIAFKLELRRYTLEILSRGHNPVVGWCRLNLSNPQ
jgi:hypothetical protein